MTGAVPDLPAGTVLHLAAGSWRYGRGCESGHLAVLVVARVRHDLAPYYGHQMIWIDGHAVGCAPDHPPCRQLLVWTSALAAAGGFTPPR